MRIINKTKYSRKMLRDIVEFCQPKKVKTFTITFGWRKDQNAVSGHYKQKTSEIVVTLPKNKSPYAYPYEWATWKAIEKKGYINHMRMDFEEEIVHVVAHELRHLEQFVRPKIHKVFGSIGKYSERDADAYAIKKQREWRRLQKPIIILDPIMPECDVYFSNKHVKRQKLTEVAE